MGRRAAIRPALVVLAPTCDLTAVAYIGHLTLSAYISLQSVDPTSWAVRIGGRLAKGVGGLKLDIYQHLLRINAGYDQVIRGLAALRKHGVFHSGELARFSALSKETRAATNSCLVGAMEIVETNEAGRRFRKRLAKERSDEQGK